MTLEGLLLPPMALSLCLCQERPNPVQVRLELPSDVASGRSIAGVLRFRIARDWHLYAFAMPPGGPTATAVSLPPGQSVTLTSLRPPVPDTIPDPVLGLYSPVYSDSVRVPVTLRVDPSAATGARPIIVVVSYQACTRRMCLPLRSDSVSARVVVRHRETP
jgi:DsbC/DsbD-like thiol-disulfide interchange protein